MSHQQDLPEHAIAIIGMACHFPGARNVDDFWEKICGGVDCITHFSEEELTANGVEPEVLRSPNYVAAKGILHDMEWFDAGFFGLSPREAAIMDPQTRHLLECAWEALEHAGHTPRDFDGTVGVFAGAGAARYFWQNVSRDPDLVRDMGQFLLRHAGNDKDFVATRISYELDLKGPSVAIQTACSTSLVAVHYACQSLLSWECDMALAGAVTIEQPHHQGYLHEPGEVLSADGRCRSYDHKSSGTVFGSGSGLVLLRRLADAVDDGDTIHAVIRGSAVNNDGAGKVSYLAPSVEGQAKAVTEALHVAGVGADTIGLVEGHGTGTPVGDPIEVTALTQAFRTQTERSNYCALGSVKSNIGHLDTAAGVASLIKAALAVREGRIPATVHFDEPNPLLQLDSSPLYINSAVIDWPNELSPRRAGVTSLGIGGTNAHMVIEQPPSPRAASESRPWQLITLSARSAAALEDASRRLVDFLESTPDAPLPDVAHTLRVGRQRFEHRRAFVCRTGSDAIESLGTGQGVGFANAATDAERREVAFLFAGGGAQYPNMGRELYESEKIFREAIDLCLDHHASTHDFDLRALLFCDESEEEEARVELQRPSRALPALFAVQYAQASLWRSWGVEPAQMIGHSMGEYTAACLAGVFSPQDGISLVAVRGRLFETVEQGGMLSVSLGEDALADRMDDRLSIAALNAPEVSVASGPVDAIDILEARLVEEGVDCRRIRIDVAAHSSMLDPILDEFGAYVDGLQLSPPEMPVISNLTGSVAGEEMATSSYWVRHLRETVRFSEGLGQLMRPDGPVLLEVGPGRTLATVAKMHSDWTSGQPALNSLPHPAERSDALAFQLSALGALWAHGVNPDWKGFSGDETRNRIPLPTYPFERAPYFIHPPKIDAVALARPAASTGGTERSDDPTDWFYRPEWTPAPAATPSSEEDPGCVLFLCDGAGLGAQVCDRLEAAGRRVLRASAGGAFEVGTEDRFTLRPGAAEDWQALFQHLAAGSALPSVVVHAWGLDGDKPAGFVDTDAEITQAVLAPLYLLQAAEGVAPGAPMRLVALTSGGIAASPQDTLWPGRALIQGPVRVAPKEIPTLRTQLVDIGPLPQSSDATAERIEWMANEVLAPSADTMVAYRGGERLTEGYVSVPMPERPLDGAVRANGTYLITGGLGGIGLVMARELADQAAVRLVLVGRSGLPSTHDRPDWLERHGEDDKTSRAIREVANLEGMGAEVMTVQADVTDVARMKEVVDLVVERFGGLHGIVHAAGILDDGPLLGRDEAQVRAVLDAKVKGAVALDQATAELHLDFILLFSSVSAVIGAPGQFDYTAANAYLDAYAHYRTKRTGQRTVSVGWGAWKDVGMAAELAGEARYGSVGGADGGAISTFEHPIFDASVSYPDSSRGLRAHLAKDRHWMLSEHQVRGGPWVLPGSGYVELLRAAVRVVEPAAEFTLEDLVFLKPFGVGASEVRELEVRLTPQVTGWSATVRGRPPSPDATWVEHATATIGSDDVADIAPEPLASVEARLGAPNPTGRPEHPVMNFGPRWANIVAEASGPTEALLGHALAEGFHSDFDDTELHPALLDMATAGALHLISGVDTSKDLLVPTGYGALRMWRPLGPQLKSHVVLRSAEEDGSFASFDVTVYDDEGRAALAVRDFTMMRVEGAALAGDGTDGGPAWLRAAISPPEGRAVLRRILGGDTGPHVLVATRPIDALIAELASGPVRTRRPEAYRRAEIRSLLPDVAEALQAHESVAEAAAIGTLDAESARVVAFVVYQPGKQATVSELRRFVRGSLGKERVPQNFVEMVSLPRGADGAVALGELRDPFALADDYTAPRTATEGTIAGIWIDLLALDRVGIHDNFLDVGGHSLVGIRVLKRIQQETGVRIEANALTMQTLEQLAADVDRLSRGDGPEGGNGSGPDFPPPATSGEQPELSTAAGVAAQR